MDIIGTISSVISLAQITAEKLNDLRNANAINADVKKRLDTLCEQSREFQANFSSIRDKFDHEGSTLSKEKRKHLKMLMDLITKYMEEVGSTLNSRTTAAPPSSSSKPLRRAWWRTKTTFKTAFNVSSINER
eukprot:IDg23449t1